MVLIGYSGVEEPRPSYFWNAWSACTAERWKMDADLEIQKISKMTREQLIEYVMDLTKSQDPVGFVHGSASWNMRKQYEDLVNKNFRDGRRADIVFRATMESIFDKLQSRLNDVNLIDVECIYNTEDIISLETVMAGNMSTSDYTALFLVHQCMVKKGKHLVYDRETTKQRIENRKHSRHLSGFIHRLSGWIQL